MSIIALKVVDMSLMNLYSTKGLSNQLIQAIENLQYHLRGILDAPEQFAEFSYELDQCTVLLRLFKEQASNGPNITRNYQTEIYLRNVLTDIEEVQELVEELENAARMRRTGLMAPPLAMPTSSELPKLHKRIRILATNMVLWLHVVNLSRLQSFSSPGILAPSSSTRALRSVWLFTVPLRASESTANVARTTLENYFSTSRALIGSLAFLNLLGYVQATTEHWGIYVAHEEAVWAGSVFEIGRRGRASEPDRNPATILRELGFDGALKWKRRAFLGRTFRNDEEILNLTKAVIATIGEEYELFARNCQEFSTLLFECIRAPSTLDEVFAGIEKLPRKEVDKILRHRCEEWKNILSSLWPFSVTDILRQPTKGPLSIMSLLLRVLWLFMFALPVLTAMEYQTRGASGLFLCLFYMLGSCTALALVALYFKSSDFATWKNGIISYKGTDAYKRVQRRMEQLVEYILNTGDEELNIDYIIRVLKRSPLANDTINEHK